MSRALPVHPNLEHLKKQAKERLSELQRVQPEAQLADAQHAVAREYGFVNWPALKAHVEAAAEAAAAGATLNSPLAGRWIANVSRSRRHPANLFQRAAIDVVVAGDTITIADVFVDEAGREERGTNVVFADGIARPIDYGCATTASWQGPRVLEVVVTQGADTVGRATYSVSPDGRVLTTSDLTGEQVIVLERAV